MDAKTNRRANVRLLIKDRYENVVADFAKAIERQPAQVWQFLNDRQIGEKLARDIEIKLKLPIGALDRENLALEEIGDAVSVAFGQATSNWKFVMRHVANLPPEAQDKIAERVLTALTEGPSWNNKIPERSLASPTRHQPTRRHQDEVPTQKRGKNKKFR